MTKVRIQRDPEPETDSWPRHTIIADLELDVIPRIGDRISLRDEGADEGYLSWGVRNVSHNITLSEVGATQIVEVTIAPLNSEPLVVYIEWQDSTERPRWISDEMYMRCDIPPRQGDIIMIGVNDERYATEKMPRAVVRVVDVTHCTLMTPGDDPMLVANQTTMAVVVRSVAQPGRPTRLYPLEPHPNN